MKFRLQLLALLAMGSCVAHAGPGSTNSASTNRILIIDPSSMSITAGKVTLTIGTLQRANGVYLGDYRINVSPYFFKNEKGKLAIVVSDESLAKLSQGKVAAIIGTATTDGKNGESRHIDATATPANPDRGMLKLWFKGGNREMIFEPAYHLAGNGTPTLPAPATETNLASHLPHSPAVSPRASLEVAAQAP
jgi:hypothetical protein